MSTDNARSEFIASFDKLQDFVGCQDAVWSFTKSSVENEDDSDMSDWSKDRRLRYDTACEKKGLARSAMTTLFNLKQQLFGPAGPFTAASSPLAEANFLELSTPQDDGRLNIPFGGDDSSQ